MTTIKVPDQVASVHRTLCERKKCPHLDKIDYTDPCVGCPEGHFGQYMRKGCSGNVPTTVAPIPNKFNNSTEQQLIQQQSGPGSLFGIIIFKLTGQRTGSCGVCGQRKRMMNQWGWWGCWKQRQIIIGWLVEEANKRGHAVERDSVAGLFFAALKEAKKINGLKKSSLS